MPSRAHPQYPACRGRSALLCGPGPDPLAA
jgi:hypothetical protein